MKFREFVISYVNYVSLVLKIPVIAFKMLSLI